MNPVWQKLNLGMVNDAMRRAGALICEEEWVMWVDHCRETGLEVIDSYETLFVDSLRKWFGRLVASQKCLLNFGNKENRHNCSLLGILGQHGKLALAGRSVDQ